MDLDSEADVFDPAFEVEFFCQAVNKRPETHALNHAKDNNPVGKPILGYLFFRFRHVFVFSKICQKRTLNSKQ